MFFLKYALGRKYENITATTLHINMYVEIFIWRSFTRINCIHFIYLRALRKANLHHAHCKIHIKDFNSLFSNDVYHIPFPETSLLVLDVLKLISEIYKRFLFIYTYIFTLGYTYGHLKYTGR